MKRMKRLLAVLMAVAMVMSMGMSVMADNFTITINPASGATVGSGETYYAYKIFDVTTTTSGEGYSYTISSDNVFYNTINNLTTYFTLTAVAGTSNPVVYNVAMTATLSGVSELPSAVVDELKKVNLSTSAYAENNTSGYSATGTTNESGVATLTVSEPGYYYVTTTTGTVVLVDTLNETAAITDKNTTPNVEKTVYDDAAYTSSSDNSDTDAAIGDTVYFKTIVKNINDVDTLVLHDTMSSGLSIDDSFAVTVTLYTSSDGQSYTDTTLTAATDYLLKTGDNVSESTDKCTFEVDFAKLIDSTSTSNTLYTSNLSLNSNSYIEVKYSATVNSSAVIYDSTASANSNTNETYVSYGDSSKSESKKTNTYVYSMNIFKYTGETVSSTAALAGAKFVIMNLDRDEYAKFTESNGVYVFTEWVSTADDATVLTTTSTGLLQVSGLDAETTYYIRETEAPSGYNKLTSDIDFVITGSDPTGTETQGAVTYETDKTTETVTISGTSYSVVAVKNSSGTEIPSTGGIGTTIFYVVGAILVVGAAVILITRRRMANRA